jgi:hypothetical protein
MVEVNSTNLKPRVDVGVKVREDRFEKRSRNPSENCRAAT